MQSPWVVDFEISQKQTRSTSCAAIETGRLTAFPLTISRSSKAKNFSRTWSYCRGTRSWSREEKHATHLHDPVRARDQFDFGQRPKYRSRCRERRACAGERRYSEHNDQRYLGGLQLSGYLQHECLC